MKTYRIAVLRGGVSSERDVSMKTGAALLRALPESYIEALDIVITKDGTWIHNGRAIRIEDLATHVDGAIIGLHGTYGEDGGVQKLLETQHIPYAGSNAFSSSIAFHKALTKDHLRNHNINLPQHMVVSKDSREHTYEIAQGIRALFDGPYIIKPICSGSSHGITIVRESALLPSKLEEALTYYSDLIVEEMIVGREATVGVVDGFRGDIHYTLPVVEIVPPEKHIFFDTDAKYSGASQEICPGRFSDEEKQILTTCASRVHEVLGLRDYSRSDFIVSPRGVYFLEVNTLPGLTETSLLPKALDAVGVSLGDFSMHLVRRMLERI